ncbi:phosphoribosylglycinamide synthetase [Neisseria sicca]|jgi:phosphoribosylformylglycinamidine synthase 2|uniref:phosphoribosylglycinamide synthetase n=1 Tax=Neisseria sicca TaxID=490 RepID=UPI000D2F7120|nr:phosphoribosylglycinamide synthetase [Neisseria sicca]
MRASLCTLAVLSALTMLAACQKEPEPAPVAPAQPQAQTQPQQEASKPNPTPPAAEAPAASSPALVQEPAASQQDPAAQAIQSKPLGEGTLALTKAKVVGQILNVEFIFTPPKQADGSYKAQSEYIKVKDFAYIDESTTKRISLLKDESGKYMIDPATDANDMTMISARSPKTIAIKFPAPPETTPTITIDFPGAGSFDSVQVSR